MCQICQISRISEDLDWPKHQVLLETLLRQVVNQTHFKVVQLENYEGDPNPAFARLYVNDTQREVVKGVKVIDELLLEMKHEQAVWSITSLLSWLDGDDIEEVSDATTFEEAKREISKYNQPVRDNLAHMLSVLDVFARWKLHIDLTDKMDTTPGFLSTIRGRRWLWNSLATGHALPY